MAIIDAEAISKRRAAAKTAFSSWHNFVEALRVKNPLYEGRNTYHNADVRWINQDLEPTPPEKRTWNFMTYCLFWFGLGFGNWSLGSTMVGIGLNWWQAIIIIFVSQLISSIVMALNSYAATAYHIGYPAVSRVVFGMYGSFYFVGARAVLASVWYGVQMYSGASHVANMLRAIFGNGYKNIPNQIPASAGITTNRMLAFFLFWLIHLIFCFFRPYQLVRFFWFKGFIMIPAVFGVFIYCMAETDAKMGHALPQISIKGGMGWFIIHAINSGMGNTATLITNQPDISRWSKTRYAPGISGLLVYPISVTISATFGILATAAINSKWGLQLWNPWDLLDAIQDHHDSSAARFAIFLAAFCWTIGILGTNIAANMIAFGSDVALLLPRYIDMKRGFFILQLLAFAIVPWKIMSSALTFTNFLSGYGLFMASVAAIMVADYLILTKGNVQTAWLFDPRKTNEYYRYHKGWNLQALIAYLIGIALPFPGFVVSLGAPPVSESALNLFYLGWILSFCTSFVSYVAICKVWPTKSQRLVKEAGYSREELVHENVEGEEPRILDEESATKTPAVDNYLEKTSS